MSESSPHKTIHPEEARKRIGELQAGVFQAASRLHSKKRNLIILFQGPDASGKGGAIRRITAGLDTSMFRVIPSSAPTAEEHRRHYLWRYWRTIPGNQGRILIFDRSWYGRVLVERVEGFAREEEWKRAYQEINHMEQGFVDGGIPVLKFWIMISKEEQYRRFKQREMSPMKQWKLTDEDWRNREKWDIYKDAADEMFARTSTTFAPWHIIYGNDKNVARIRALELVHSTMVEMLDGKPYPAPPEEGLPLIRT